jgi:hypothetical protein
MMEHEKQIEALIRRDAYFMPLPILTEKDRNAIEAMYAQNKRLREVNKAALDWFSVAMKGDIMAAPDAGLIMRKLQQALKGAAE